MKVVHKFSRDGVPIAVWCGFSAVFGGPKLIAARTRNYYDKCVTKQKKCQFRTTNFAQKFRPNEIWPGSLCQKLQNKW